MEVKREGISLDWKIFAVCIFFVISTTIGATAWCTNISTTSAQHTSALIELKSDIRSVNLKVNALLIQKGINPAQVVSEANAAAAAEAAANK